MMTLAAALVLMVQTAPAVAATPCAGAGATIVSAAVKSVNPAGALNHYELSGTVTNQGASQASNVLQSVDIYKGPEKLDTKSIPPLKAGQSYTFNYESVRSTDAGNGTTTLRFVMDQATPSVTDCAAASNRQSVTF
jgi:hypothetical protein